MGDFCFNLIIYLMTDFRFIVIDNFETASLPTTSPEDRKRLLSFVVCGGGPTGVETAAVSPVLVFLRAGVIFIPE